MGTYQSSNIEMSKVVVLSISISLGDVTCSCATHATSAVEGYFLVRLGLFEPKFLLESLRRHVKGTWKHGKRNVNG